MQNGKLNVEQRKALVKLVQKAYERKIEKQRSACGEAVARITREVKEELGVARMEEAIAGHEQAIKSLEAEKERLGFSRYRNDGTVPGSEATKLIEKRAAAERQKVAELEAERDRAVSSIWTAAELSEVKPMIDSANAS